MPPKRRRLSVDESGHDVKRQTTENEPSAESATVPSDGGSEKLSEAVEKDNRKCKSKTVAELPAEAKARDDTPKPTRISERLIIKRNRLDEETENQIQVPSQNQITPKKPKAPRQPVKQHKGGKKKLRRPCTQWSIRDKKLFFIGLGMFGKNFEEISNKISQAAKLQGLPVKDKMQVRYFYYRCWAKISKFIHLNNKGVKMKNTELYGLINYGVLEKHVRETDPQFGKCLNELIHYGETTYTARNVRGKKMRVGKIRTPICKYLKKINRIEDKQASEIAASQKIPHQITLELTPRNSKAWAKVQSVSQNPRVRLKMTTNRTLESVFKYLDKKWMSSRVRLKESLGVNEDPEEELIFYLHPECKITPVKLIPQEQEKVDVTFTSYRENILPTLQKPKKTKAVKEPEKSAEDKDKKLEGNTEEQGLVGKVNSGSDSAEICSNSKPKDGIALTPEEKPDVKDTELQPAFANLLTGSHSDIVSLCHDETAGLGHTSEPFVMGDPPVVREAPVGCKPPAVLLEDENAMFPDYSSFSPPNRSLTQSSKPSSPSSELSAPSSLPSVISSPTVSKKKSTKSSKKTAVSEEDVLPSDNCDKNMAVSFSDSSSSPTKADLSAPAQNVKDSLEKEIYRLSTLAADGFTVQTSNTITLLHLSLILGRKSVIRLEYEWKEKRPHKVQLPPLLSQAANQMSNVLRRLCNLATLELTDFVGSEKTADQNKSVNKNVPCAHCGRESSAKTRGKRHSQSERKDCSKEVATMTDPIKVDPPPLAQVFHTTSVVAAGGRTFVAGPNSQGPLQINGPDPVFRVPVVPTVKTVPPREEQLRLEEQQRLQMQATAIMQQGPSPRNRLLKKRTMNPRTKKAPSIIVQRTLLPKVETGQIVAYVQQPAPQPVGRPLVVEIASDKLGHITPTMVNIVTCNTQPKIVNQNHTQGNHIGQTSDILTLAAQSAEINSSSVLSPVKADQSSGLDTLDSTKDTHQVGALLPLSVAVTTTASTSRETLTEMAGPALNGHGDISISDLDISMSSVTGSNLGPDAGDKFLDMVLQNSEQGFSGLISTPKKSGQSIESYHPAGFDPSVLRTPPHVGISGYLHLSSIYPSPIKLGISEQTWINPDLAEISLSSVLGEQSPFKSRDRDKSSEKSSSPTPTSYAAFFETSSSDIPETGSAVFSKPSMVTEISLSSLLGDSSFKENPSGVSPPVSNSTVAATKSDGHAVDVGFFSEAISSEGPQQLFCEISQDSYAKLDVDRALHSVVSDSSLDLVSKFEFLAAQITGQQDRDPSITGEKQDKLLGGAGGMENVEV